MRRMRLPVWTGAMMALLMCVSSLQAPLQANNGKAGRLTTSAAQAPSAATALDLIPAPRDLKQTGGSPFVLTQRTRLVVERGIGGSNFQGAEMLAGEIDNWTGWTPKISVADRMPEGSDFIYIGSAQKDSHLKSALESAGLSMPKGFDSQGYAILTDSHRILIGGASAQGAFYGVQTLRQLLRPAPGKGEDGAKVDELNCPAVQIRDWPAMGWRGVSMDVSRGPIPTLAFMEKQIRILAGYKINLYGLYMENAYPVPGQPLFSPQRDAFTPAELKQLVAYGQKYYVTLLPELETFGHLHNVLRYDIYSKLAETPHGAVLTPVQPGTYTQIQKMIGAVAPLFPGPLFHVGADETFELGTGQSKQLAEKEGLGHVYLNFIARLNAMVRQQHKQTLFWGDIAQHYPQLLSILPKNVIPVIWIYRAEPSYASALEPFRKAGLSIFVSPGISNWQRIYPDFNSAFVNIRNMVRDGQSYHALGMLNTEWKDRGEALSGMDWPGFVFGAACAWQPGQSSAKAFLQSYDWAFYRNRDHTFRDILNKLAATNTLLGSVKMTGALDFYFWQSPFSQTGANEAETAAPVTHELRVDAEQAWESLLENRKKARLHAGTLDDLIFAAHRLDTLGMKFEYTQEMSHLYWDAYRHMDNHKRVNTDLNGINEIDGRLQDLRDEATELRTDYAQRWLAESGPYLLGAVRVRYTALAILMQQKIQTIGALQRDFAQTGQLPTPQSLGFFLQPSPPAQNSSTH